MSQNARNPKIGVVIVLYRQSLDRCPSYRSLGFPANDSFLILCDNSPQPQPVPPSAAYIHNPHNPGVSAAYNQAARLALQKGCTHMLLADQDSEFPPQYVAQIERAIALSPEEKLYFPLVRTPVHLISPAKFSWGRAWYAGSLTPGKLPLRSFRPINSGLVVSLDHFQAVGGYDEQVTLDFSDFAFIERSLAILRQGVLLDIEVKHSLSSETADFPAALRRFQSFSRSASAYARNYRSPLTILWLQLRRVSLALRYKSIKFLFA